uniref:Uncharacterized protein n=1 Tax=Rhizophora mucronata TaxID=61149 RepID=A0A2P2P9K9_RHIMU
MFVITHFNKIKHWKAATLMLLFIIWQLKGTILAFRLFSWRKQERKRNWLSWKEKKNEPLNSKFLINSLTYSCKITPIREGKRQPKNQKKNKTKMK